MHDNGTQMTRIERMNADKGILHEELTGSIIAAFYTVYNSLGYGFLEKVYENALMLEMQKAGLSVVQQQPITVYYESKPVGEYFADLMVNDLIILELKTAEALRQEHALQLTNYLKGTGKQVGLVLNFGPKPEFKRVVFSHSNNPRKSAKSASSAFYSNHA
jgi:GxxExxY protein